MRIDSLQLLMAAQIPDDIETIEASMRAIAERADAAEPGIVDYDAVHERLDQLLAERDRLIAEHPRRKPATRTE